jgi:hypothetical protein
MKPCSAFSEVYDWVVVTFWSIEVIEPELSILEIPGTIHGEPSSGTGTLKLVVSRGLDDF